MTQQTHFWVLLKGFFGKSGLLLTIEEIEEAGNGKVGAPKYI